MPPTLAEHLAAHVAPQVTAQLQPRLSHPLFGGLLRRYLPQTWWFVSPGASATLHVGPDGQSQAFEGSVGPPDVVISWTAEAFDAVLAYRDPSRVPPGSGRPNVEKRTPKGAAAFDYLRSRLGL